MELLKIQLRPRFLDHRYEQCTLIIANMDCTFLAGTGEGWRRDEFLFHLMLFFASQANYFSQCRMHVAYSLDIVGR